MIINIKVKTDLELIRLLKKDIKIIKGHKPKNKIVQVKNANKI